MRLAKLILSTLLMVGLALPILASVTIAQDSNILLTLTVPEWMENMFDDELLGEFEAQNPGVEVVLVSAGDSMYFGGAAYNIEDYLENASEYAQTADVLYVDNYTLGVESTRAGFYLDLSPLTSSDLNLNPTDFFPAAWQSFQWDGGIWGLPASLSLNMLVYNKTHFDELGLPYPNEAWTIDDFISTVRALSETNAAGEVTMPGFIGWGNEGLLFRAFLGEGVYDASVIPNAPNFQNPELEALLTTWAEFQQEGYTGRNYSGSGQDIPMRIDGLWALSAFNNTEDEWGASLLPGGIAAVRAQGFAVSAGTQYPEQAYELVKFLTGNVEVVSQFFGDSPARQSLVGVESEDNPAFFIQLPAEAEALRDQALMTALPASELRFMDYINLALNNMDPEAENYDAVTALQEAESQAIANLQVAEEQRSSSAIMVAQPTPTPVLSAGEIALRFSYTSFISPLPNRELWDQAIREFTASDPQVGQIVFDTGFASVDQYINQEIDCFIQPFNAVPNLDLQTVLNLDPFMNEDPAFTEGDFLSGVLAQVRRDNMTWGYPLFLQPEVLWYNTNRFNESGAATPFTGWAVDTFVDALQTLRVDPDDDAPFVPGGSGNTYILLLTAAFGGLPLDYRTSPPTIDFDNPETVDALRQVLDLAKDGYIQYNALGTLGGGFFGGGDLLTLYNETLSALSWRLRMASQDISSDYEDPYRLTSFPRGRQFTGIAYDIGAGYILSTAQNPEACYRWFSFLSGRPDLFTAMPARRSAIDALESSAVQGEDLAAIYAEIDALLQDPTTVIVPSQFSGAGGDIGEFVVPIWLNRAMDAYVLEDADLETALSDAQYYATTYMECISGIERVDIGTLADMSLQEQMNYTRQFIDCAVSVDPSLESMFSFMTTGEAE